MWINLPKDSVWIVEHYDMNQQKVESDVNPADAKMTKKDTPNNQPPPNHESLCIF